MQNNQLINPNLLRLTPSRAYSDSSERRSSKELTVLGQTSAFFLSLNTYQVAILAYWNKKIEESPQGSALRETLKSSNVPEHLFLFVLLTGYSIQLSMNLSYSLYKDNADLTLEEKARWANRFSNPDRSGVEDMALWSPLPEGPEDQLFIQEQLSLNIITSYIDRYFVWLEENPVYGLETNFHQDTHISFRFIHDFQQDGLPIEAYSSHYFYSDLSDLDTVSLASQSGGDHYFQPLTDKRLVRSFMYYNSLNMIKNGLIPSWGPQESDSDFCTHYLIDNRFL